VRVRYDDQIFVTLRVGGIARYFVELIRQFSDHPELDVMVQRGWRWTRNEHALDARLGERLSMPGGSRRRVLAAANRAAGVVPTLAPDVIHPTYYGPAGLARAGAAPLVVTVHDMTPELFPGLFPSGNPHERKREYVRRAAAVLCVSENTRTDLLDLYGPIDAPIVVTHLGVDERFKPRSIEGPLAPPYVLYVGSRDGYKDFDVALESFAQIAPEQRALTLLVVGGGPFTQREQDLIARWRLGPSVRHRPVSDAELPRVFGEATIFVNPSRYEGFGLTALEAMASGTPTVLADSSSLPEVGGPAAAYFPPGDSSALAAQLRRILGDPIVRREMSARGLARARDFTWLKTATATSEAYRLAQDSPHRI
jgi:glycosyltransferase involved in cell wall biosynthesis